MTWMKVPIVGVAQPAAPWRQDPGRPAQSQGAPKARNASGAHPLSRQCPGAQAACSRVSELPPLAGMRMTPDVSPPCLTSSFAKNWTRSFSALARRPQKAAGSLRKDAPMPGLSGEKMATFPWPKSSSDVSQATFFAKRLLLPAGLDAPAARLASEGAPRAPMSKSHRMTTAGVPIARYGLTTRSRMAARLRLSFACRDALTWMAATTRAVSFSKKTATSERAATCAVSSAWPAAIVDIVHVDASLALAWMSSKRSSYWLAKFLPASQSVPWMASFLMQSR